MKKRNGLQTLTAGALALGVLALSVMFFVVPKTDFSENENRYLAKAPVMNWEEIKSGQYMDDISTYVADHFPFRNFFMNIKAKSEKAMGRREINGIYIAEDGYLIEPYETPANTKRIGKTLFDFHEKIKESGVEEKLMLVPTASYVHEDKLPAYAPLPKVSQAQTAEAIYKMSGMDSVDCSSYLQEEEGQLYYYTDHHWTTRGAYQGYLAYCEEVGFEPVDLRELEAETVTEAFYGTVYSKVSGYAHRGDTITIYNNPSDDLMVYYTDTKETAKSLYAMEYVSQKDKYSLFLDNLHTLVEITNASAETDRVLVLIKDSYANSMVPFLAHHFKKIYVFDTRYYKHGPAAFIGEHPEVTDVLLLYNLNTIDTDAGIRGIY